MRIYRRLRQSGSKLAIILQEPLCSTVPFIPPCVTREKYFTARCAKPLRRRVPLQTTSQATVCEPLLYGSVAKLAEDTLQNYCGALNCCVSLLRRIFNCQDSMPSTYRGMAETFCSPVFKNFVTMHKPIHMVAVYFALYL